MAGIGFKAPMGIVKGILKKDQKIQGGSLYTDNHAVAIQACCTPDQPASSDSDCAAGITLSSDFQQAGAWPKGQRAGGCVAMPDYDAVDILQVEQLRLDVRRGTR